MNIILFDSETRVQLLPLTFTKPIAELRAGIFTIREKWSNIFANSVSTLPPDYLKKVFKTKISNENILIDGSTIPDEKLLAALKNLKLGNSLTDKIGNIIAAKVSKNQLEDIMFFDNYLSLSKLHFNTEKISHNYLSIKRPWQLFTNASKLIEDDFIFATKNRKSAQISPTNRYLNPKNIFIEENATVEFSILNASQGYIYVGKGTEIMENCVVRGSLALGEQSVLKIGAKIYGPSIIGPFCKIGGEVNNSVFSAYSNKAHDGFTGNSVIGEWCNLGADTNNSNLKNTYEEVKLWSYATQHFENTGLQFCGLIMGDHCKCSINTMFNTGTVIGVGCNIFGDGFHRNFIPSFSWGSNAKMSVFQIEKALLSFDRMMMRRDLKLTANDVEMYNHIFNIEQKQ